MKARIATVGLTLLIAAPAAHAQQGARPAGRPGVFAPAAAAAPGPANGPGRTKADGNVYPAAAELPTPTAPDQIKPATIVLPNDPIEPWLLTRDAGPFMVIARTFRGPDAERYALALAMELRRDHGLPAYILRIKDFPRNSNIRGVPPFAPAAQRRSQLTDPEKTRTYDEAAVLVGNEKTLAGSEALLHRVKKIKPKCLGEIPAIFNWRDGLKTALRTTNPYVPTQDIYPGRGKRDHLISQMNEGPRSVYKCPARYTLQVAEFGGRAVFNADKKTEGFFGNDWLRRSPLVTAADDAERLAEAIAKDPEIQRTGFQPYVYHDRTSSKVMIGAFERTDDPAAAQLHQTMLKRAVPLGDKNKGLVIAPASQLTDLQDPYQPIKLTGTQ